MASDFKINSDGTLAMENGDFVIISGLDEVCQSLRIRLKMWLGEWFLDTRLGTDYLGKILVKNTPENLKRAEAEIRRVIFETDHVLDILEYSQELQVVTENNININQLVVNFTVNTDFGQAELNEVL